MPALTARRTGVRLPAPPPCPYDPGIGLAADLGYGPQAQSTVQRWLARFGSMRIVSAISRRVMPSLDRFVLARSHGSLTATSWLVGLPTLWLTTTGARSGQKRRVPLFGVPIDGDVAILGTHFGHRDTPAWVYNIEANREVEVEYRELALSAVARRASPEEELRIWEAASGTYPGYALYTERASHREIRVFVLEPR